MILSSGEAVSVAGVGQGMMIWFPAEGTGAENTIIVYPSTFPWAVEIPSDTEHLFGTATGEFTISPGTKGVTSFLECRLCAVVSPVPGTCTDKADARPGIRTSAFRKGLLFIRLCPRNRAVLSANRAAG